MHRPVFMSAEHVARMNEILGQNERSREACRQLDREYVLVYELRNGSSTVYWTTRFSPEQGVVFSLEEPTSQPDVVLRGDYKEAIRAIAAFKAGQDVEMPWGTIGDESVLAVVSPLLETARRSATLETVMPEV